MEGENKEFLRYVQVRFMKYPQNNKQKKWNEKAQGIVEYALILAFIVGIGTAIFANGGLADAVGKAYFDVSTAIRNAIDGSNAAKKEYLQKSLDDALRAAIKAGRIKMADNQWIEIDVQQDENTTANGAHHTEGGSSAGWGSSDVQTGGKNYHGFQGIWDASLLKAYEMEVGQEGGWVGVRVKSNGDGSYTSYYYQGDANTVKKQQGVNYKDTNSMNRAVLKDGSNLLVHSEDWR